MVKRLQQALLKIQRAKEENSTWLELDDLDSPEIPKELGQLTHLEDLFARTPSVTKIPAEIGSLTNLKRLFLGYTQIDTLPKEIAQLSNLELLDISDTNFTELPTEIRSLPALRSLMISGLPLKVLPSFVYDLRNLEVLAASRCGLQRLPNSVSRLSNLRVLSVGGNYLTSLPQNLFRLIKLESLNIGNNQLHEISASLCNLTNLRTLTLGSIVYDHSDRWQHYYYGQENTNHLRSLPDCIGSLKALKLLDLTACGLSKLPDSLRELLNLQELYLHENPELQIPPEILGPAWRERIDAGKDKEPARPADILNFYFAARREPSRPLNEAKLVLVGQGAVGKTSLVNRLLDDAFDPEEKKTEGISIRQWQLDVDGEDISLNVWDFGGQEIMHATHQFFLTKRSIYLLILNSREERKTNRVDYWLRTIESFAEGSPVLIICNKSDEQPMDLDWSGLQRKFTSIRAFVKQVSCRDGAGVADVLAAIRET
jgi:internalin A